MIIDLICLVFALFVGIRICGLVRELGILFWKDMFATMSAAQQRRYFEYRSYGIWQGEALRLAKLEAE
jgi:hypothetical protein